MSSHQDLRNGVKHLSAQAILDLEHVFQQIDNPDAAVVRDALAAVLPGLVELYGSAAATLSADWYDHLREQAAVRGRFLALAAELPGSARTDALAGWAVSPLYSATPDLATAVVKASGGLERIISNASRDTVTQSSVADPGAKGWYRVGGGRTCSFCAGILAEGTIYTEASADFLAHDHCSCGAVPQFGK